MVNVTLEQEALVERAKRITNMLTDCDGVLTDGGVYYGQGGEMMLRFHRRDGMGVARLRGAGVVTSIVTQERSPIVQHRATKLGVRLFEGIKDKLQLLPLLLAELDVSLNELSFIGDDVNDLPLLLAVRETGLTAAPADAEASVREVVHFVSAAAGGQGAFREFSEWLLKLRGSE